jgi:transcriptional regulator with XRE-family HTH domain
VETFGQALNRLRGAHSLSEVARRANIDVGHLSRVARGRRPGNADLARALDRALGTGGQLGALMAQAMAQAQPTRFEVGGELDLELHDRYPGESGTADFYEALHSIKSTDS